MTYVGTIIGEIDGAVDIGGEWRRIVSPITYLNGRKKIKFWDGPHFWE